MKLIIRNEFLRCRLKEEIHNVKNILGFYDLKELRYSRKDGKVRWIRFEEGDSWRVEDD